MGRARAFPSPLGWTHKRFHTPYVAILMQTGLSILVIALVGVFWNAVSAFGFISFLEGLAASVGFIAIMVAAIAYFRRIEGNRNPLRTYVIPIIGIVILLPAVYTAFYPNPGLPLSIAPWLLVGWLLVGGAYLLWRERARGERDVAVLGALALRDADGHAVRIEVRDPEGDDLAHAQAPGVGRGQQEPMARVQAR